MSEEMTQYQLAAKLAELRERRKKTEDDAKELRRQETETERDLVKAMELHDVDKFTKDGATFSRTSRVFVSEKRPEEFRAWARANGHDALIKETVNNQTLRSFCKQQIEAGDGEPPGVEIALQSSIRITNRRN